MYLCIMQEIFSKYFDLMVNVNDICIFPIHTFSPFYPMYVIFLIE